MRSALKLTGCQRPNILGGKRRRFSHSCGFIMQNTQSCNGQIISARKFVAAQVCLYSTNTGKKNYYTILGVTPNATQAQIKEAYYKLSMKHHPDRHSGSDEATDQFQEISEAYSVLGEHELRKKYDRGLVVDGKMARPHHEHKPTPRPKPSMHRYDFDEWTRMHYQEAMKRTQRNMRDRYAEELEKSKHKMREGSQRLVVIGVLIAVLVFVYLVEKWHRQTELDTYLKESDV